MADEDQLDEGQEEELVQIPDTDDAADDQDDADEGEDKAQAAEPAEARKATRRERQEQRRRDHEERIKAEVRKEYEGQMRQLQGQLTDALGRMSSTTERMAEVVDRTTRPPEKSIREQMQERVRQSARGINKDDPQSVEKFLDEQVAAADEIVSVKAREIALEEIKKFRQTLPQGPSQADAPYHAIAPWMSKPQLKQAVQLEINRLGARGGPGGSPRDFTDDRVWDSTVREAITKVGNDWGLPVHGGSNSNGNNGKPAAAVMGARGGGSAAGGSAAVPESSYTRLMREAADTHPEYMKLPKEVRYKRYYKKEVEPRLSKSRSN